jgi:hypothetical protein
MNANICLTLVSLIIGIRQFGFSSSVIKYQQADVSMRSAKWLNRNQNQSHVWSNFINVEWKTNHILIGCSNVWCIIIQLYTSSLWAQDHAEDDRTTDIISDLSRSILQVGLDFALILEVQFIVIHQVSKSGSAWALYKAKEWKNYFGRQKGFMEVTIVHK